MDGSCQIPKLPGYNIDPKIFAVLREKTIFGSFHVWSYQRWRFLSLRLRA